MGRQDVITCRQHPVISLNSLNFRLADLSHILCCDLPAVTHHSLVQTEVGHSLQVKSGQVTLETEVRGQPQVLLWCVICFCSLLGQTSSHSVAPTFPKSPASQLTKSKLRRGRNPGERHTHTHKQPMLTMRHYMTHLS